MTKRSQATAGARIAAPAALDALLGQLRTLIQEARQQALRTVDVVQVRTCWEIGRHIVEFEQEGAQNGRNMAVELTLTSG